MGRNKKKVLWLAAESNNYGTLTQQLNCND
jgi:hypothetical protein